jgi:hypothetical protein
MNEAKTTKRAFRWLLPWNDENEERWLAEQARSGWRLRKVGCFGGYTFERSAPTEVVYRIDVGPPKGRDRSEYFGLFSDAGWEHLGNRGLWQFFSREATDGSAPEIYTDTSSRIGKYRRIVAFMAIMVGALGTQVAVQSPRAHWGLVTVAPLVVLAVFVYFIVRTLLRIHQLRRGDTPRG